MLPVLAPSGSGAVQMSGAGAGHPPSAAPSSCSPARATLHHGVLQPAASGEYSSPLAKPTGASVTARKRKAAEDGDGAETADNETVVNHFSSHRHHHHPQLQGQSSRLGPQPSGRGEVGGSMIPGGGEVAMPSRFETSAVALSQPHVHMAASVHMPSPPSHRATPQDSGSNQPEEDATARGRGARGRATTSKVLFLDMRSMHGS